jgi:predicted adenine nucleotide alpha hydrolase (AANH) superfamily ATPase
MTKILLHICCAPCGAYVVERLKEDGFEPVVFFSNDNIMPREEYFKREQEVRDYFARKNIEVIVDDYSPKDWLDQVEKLKLSKEPEGGKRCLFCYDWRLLKTAQRAKEIGIEHFATTLTISPHKKADEINVLGQKIADQNKLTYLDSNWKKKEGYKQSCQIAREENFYRQNYCGCCFSVRY